MSAEINAILDLLGTVKDSDAHANVVATAVYLKYERYENARQELGLAIAKKPNNENLLKANELLGTYIINHPSAWARFLGIFRKRKT
jgi:hypothetical protein